MSYLKSVAASAFQWLPKPAQLFILKSLRRLPPWDPASVPSQPPLSPGLEIGPPHFVGIGAQKAGTSWWYTLVAQHPEFFRPEGIHKEVHFFKRYWHEPFGREDVAQYHRLFPRPPGRKTGEWTPDYMLQHWVPPLMREAAPNTKLIAVLRDPVERYVSGIAHDLVRGSGLDAKVAAQAFAFGRYSEQLSWWRHAFPTDQILVLQYERCREQPLVELARTYRFIGMSDDYMPESPNTKVSETQQSLQLSESACRYLGSLYEADVRSLLADYPEIDASLWPNFTHLT